MDKESNLALLAATGLLGGGGYLAYKKYREGKRRAESTRIPMHKVDSSMIHELGYSPKSKVMHARFNTGRRYRYEGLPLREYKRLREADSIGSHFNSHIRGRYDHEKVAYAGMIGGAILGAGVGGLMQDSQGNSGGLGGALTGAIMGGATGHLLGRGVKGTIGKIRGSGKPPAQPAPAPAPTPTPKTGLQGLDNLQLPNMTPQFNVGQSLLQVPGALLGGAKRVTQPLVSGVQSGARRLFTPNLNWQAPGHSINIAGVTPPPIVKGASYEGGITFISNETFEKVAYAPAVTTLAQAGVGAAVGAMVNSENRMQGALTGGVIGGIGGAFVGREISRAMSKSGLDDAGLQLYKEQAKRLKTQLGNAKGITNRHNTIETFVKDPANKEFAGVYRQVMLGGTIGSAGIAAAATVPQNKTAAYRAVERLHRVRSY